LQSRIGKTPRREGRGNGAAKGNEHSEAHF